MRNDKDPNRQRGWAINGRFLTQRMTGVQRYAHEIVTAMDSIIAEVSNNRPDIQLVIPPLTKAALPLSEISVRRTSFGAGHLWDQCVLPFYAGSGLLSLGNFGPLFARRHIVCIHDANTFILPESYSRSFSAGYRTLLPILGRQASKVATVSRFSADMLIKFGVCPVEKIFIAPNGHEHVLRWDASRAQIPLLHGLKRPYVFLLGSTAKHKNINVVLGHAAALDDAGIDIVVAGGASAIFAPSEQGASHSNIHQLGFITDDELAALYESALCLAFPSKTEGFGIPPLEAMALGCPVISSNAASLVEVGGDAFVYVHPDDERGWRDAIVGLRTREDLRKSLSAKGRVRALRFSWRNSAQIYLNAMESIVS